MTATRRSYDRIARRYAAEFGDELRHKPLDRALLAAFAELTRPGLVADVGCGPGHVAAHLADLGVTTIGLDLSPEMCAAGHRTSGGRFAAADMTALPLADATLAGIVCLYAVIHLDATARQAAYHEFARVLEPDGHALVAFHTEDASTPAGHWRAATELLGEQVDLTFHFLDPATESAALTAAGLTPVARLDRAPHDSVEHASHRTYLLTARTP